MAEKICPYCGKAFISRYGKVYCSDSCGHKARYERVKEARLVERAQNPIPCRGCGKFFIQKFPFQRYCSEECKVSWHKKNPLLYKHNCVCCGKSFESTSYKSKCCSRACAAKMKALERVGGGYVAPVPERAISEEHKLRLAEPRKIELSEKELMALNQREYEKSHPTEVAMRRLKGKFLWSDN